MLDLLFFKISRLNNACSPLVYNPQINQPIGIKDISFLSFQLWSIYKDCKYDLTQCNNCLKKMYLCILLKVCTPGLEQFNHFPENILSRSIAIPSPVHIRSISDTSPVHLRSFSDLSQILLRSISDHSPVHLKSRIRHQSFFDREKLNPILSKICFIILSEGF